MSKPIYILNGPNLNLLGRREPDVYGAVTLDAIARACADRAAEYGADISFHQTNNEGELVDLIHEAGENGMGIIINAGAYTHTSVALLDALKAVDLPAIEVHLSNIFQREDFRHHSYISPAALGMITGLGALGYELAVEALIRHVED